MDNDYLLCIKLNSLYTSSLPKAATVLLLLVLFRLAVQAQPTYLFKHLTTANGLVSNQAGMSMQDREGFIWIATQTGLQRYDGIRFRTYQADVHNPDALQSDWISTVFEDSRKRLWIGTNVAGVSRLDRRNQKFYNYNMHLQTGEQRINGVWQFLEDDDHVIWLAAHDAFYRFDETSNRFIKANALLEMETNMLPSTMAKDRNGDLWFGTTNGVRMISRKDRKLYHRNNSLGKLAIFSINEPVASITFDHAGFVWVSTGYEKVLYRWTKSNNVLRTYMFNSIAGRPAGASGQVHEFLGGVFAASNGRLFVPLLSRGFAVYDYAADSFHIMGAANHSRLGLHLRPNTFASFTMSEDREHNVWITGDAGCNIFNLDKPAFSTYNFPAADESDEHPSEVSDFLQAPNGDIYISGYYFNAGIKRYDRNLNFKEQYRWPGVDKGQNQLWNLYQAANGTIWAPNQAGSILQLDPARGSVTLMDDSLLHGAINGIITDRDHHIWIAHDRKGLIGMDASGRNIKMYDQFRQVPGGQRRKVMCLLDDGDELWVGTVLSGLQLFSKKTGLFTESYLKDETNPYSITDNNITGLVSYNQDTLIVATLNGLNFFNKKTRRFSALLSKDGLPNNLVQAIKLDRDRQLWAAFAGGLSRINPRSGSIVNFSESDGVIDNRFNHSFVQLDDGRMLIGAEKSFLVFDPAAVNRGIHTPDVKITDFRIFDSSLDVDSIINSDKSLDLGYRRNSLYFEFSSMRISNAAATRYYYKLEGIDKEWTLATPELSVRYNQLPPGNYIFKVRTESADGIADGKTTSVRIHIIPPFWLRWWFRIAVLLLLAAGFIAFTRWRERNIRKLEAGKLRLQKLTAENYKTQFEAEQISNFFSTSLLNKTDVDDVLWDVAKNLIGKMGFVDCIIYLWNEDHTRLVQKAGYGLKGSLELLAEQHFDVVPGQGVVGQVALTGEPILIGDTRKDPNYRVDDLARLSEICVPIKYNEQLIGVIDSEHPELNFYTRQHIQVLTTIATLVAGKIRSIESEQRLRHQKAELADVNQQLAEVQLAALRSQMNPHFIFNALNSIKKFVVSNEPANAEKYLGKFSKLIRSILDNSQSGWVTIEKELQLLRLYLDLEQLRFGERMTYSIETDEATDPAIRIPSMIIQPFVENAMLHGIMHLEAGGRIVISFKTHPNWITVTVEDNGVGRKRSAEYKSENVEPHHSIGIENAGRRLLALRKSPEVPAGIAITDLENESPYGTGTRVVITIPLN